MLNVYTSGRKKGRTWSTGTVLVSLAAHAFALFFALIVPFGPPEATSAEPMLVDEWEIPTTPPKPRPEQPRTTERDEPADEAPVVGRTLQVTPPITVPPMLPAPDAGDRPVDPTAYSGVGPVGDVIGTPLPGDSRPPTGSDRPAGGDGVYDAADVGEAPALSNAAELRRVFERYYPSVLRDSGVRGRAVLQFVVNADGRVDPSSVVVVSATRPEFASASTRAVERFRFRPATVYGQPVRVLITMPIDWTVQQD